MKYQKRNGLKPQFLLSELSRLESHIKVLMMKVLLTLLGRVLLACCSFAGHEGPSAGGRIALICLHEGSPPPYLTWWAPLGLSPFLMSCTGEPTLMVSS